MTKIQNLTDNVAAVFAANGAIAREVALSLAAVGAELYLSGRTMESVEQLAHEIRSKGGKAHAYPVDATHEKQVEEFTQRVVEETGRLDVVFNGIGLRAAELQYGTPSTELPFEVFLKALEVHLGSQFLTARVGARHMMRAGSKGTILMLTASLSRIKAPFMAGISAACAGIEGLTRVLAAEYGLAGIKVICLNSTALLETRTIKETYVLNAQTAGVSPEIMAQQLKQGALLGMMPSTADIGRLAAFLATDTGALLNSHVVDADYGVHGVI